MKTILMLLLISFAMGELYSQNSDYTSWWIDIFGDYKKTEGKNDPRVKWADAVFNRVKNVADRAKPCLPGLFIINSDKGIFAVAIPDGGIVISRKALDICYSDAGKDAGNRRMAYILGHELAHMANNDFVHKEAFQALEKWGSRKAVKELKKYFYPPEKERETVEIKKRELLADRMGVFYAAMAGYDVGGLFLETDNFLTHWAGQTGVGMLYDDAGKHPTLEERLMFLRSQLKDVPQRLELFKAGVLLLQMGSYHDAAAAFREFSKHYPAREVYNNIGVCYLNLALRHLSLNSGVDYFRFRLSTVIDNSTSAETFHTTRSDYLKDKDFRMYIEKAEEFLRRAAAVDKLDRTCRYNLAAVLIVKKEYAEAQALCKKILEKNSKDVFALNNKAVAFYYYGKEEGLDTVQKAIQFLETAHALSPRCFEVLYNLASLKQERNRLAGAKIYWEKYLDLSDAPRDNYYSYIGKLMNRPVPPESGKKAEPPRIPGGIALGDAIAPIREKWKNRNFRPFKLGNEETGDSDNWYLSLQVLVGDNVRIVALDGTVEVVEWEFSPVVPLADVLAKYGPPEKILHHSAGCFYIYEKGGYSISEVNGKAHSYIRFSKAL
jgi:tetratricopeptide (TPR) repeat protein